MTIRQFILRTASDVWSFIAPAPERDPEETAKEREEERGKEGRGFEVIAKDRDSNAE